MNNVVVRVLYLLRILHRRIIVYRALTASLATALYGNKMLDCLLSRSQRLVGLSSKLRVLSEGNLDHDHNDRVWLIVKSNQSSTCRSCNNVDEPIYNSRNESAEMFVV